MDRAQSLGNWASADPIGFKGDLNNLFRYCENNPVNLTDPTGFERPPGRLSGPLYDFATANRENPLGISGMFVGPLMFLDGSMFGAVHQAAADSRQQILDNIAATEDPIQQTMGYLALGYGYAGEGFAQLGVVEGGNAVLSVPILAGVGAVKPVTAPGTTNVGTETAKQSAVQDTLEALQKWLGNGAVVKRADAKGIVVQSKDGLRQFRMDLQGHGKYPPHGHLEVFDPTKGRFVDAPGVPHHLNFNTQPLP